uniref:Titin n=1 Tax=Astyanax mexicanus TaxID=7994 RepID=A0A8B9H748_ASTMX
MFKICNLEEGIGYEFRVYAENIVGVGRASKVSDSFVARDPCDPPGTPEAIAISKNHVVIQWTKPQYDGGSKVTGYIVEKRDLPQGHWMRVNFTNVVETEFAITGLTADQQYEFRVTARNAAGMFSEPSDSTGPITATDEIEPPSVSMDPKYKDVIVVNAGDNLVLDADIHGKPIPDVQWLKEGKEMEKKLRYELKTTQKSASITIKDCTRLDSGHYDLVLSNSGGTKTIPITVRVLDRPAPPSGPLREVSAEEWTMCTPPTGLQATRLTVDKLKENGEYNFRVCAINSEGVGEPADVHGTVIAAEKIEAPEIELDADLRKVVSVRAGGSLRLFITIRGRPEPTVKWEKEEGALTDRAVIESTGSYTMLVIDNVHRFDSGKYILTLENKTGTKSAFVNVRVLDTPSAPQKLEIKDVKKDSVTVCWETPLTDGGSKITNYIVEKRESIRKIEELPEGGIFYFRVCAVNEYGFGVMAETKNPVKVAQVPMPPGKITLVDATKTSVTLAWVKPAHDGGSKVLCYNVEMLPKGTDKWGVVCTAKVPEATIANLTPNETYSFRVIEFGVPIRAKDIEIEPTVNLLFNTFSVKAGGDLTVEVPIRGRPKPVVSWKKDGLPLKQTTSLSINNTLVSSKIIIKEATIDHVGKYEITLANTAGTISTDINVVVLDKPGPPSSVKVDAVTADSITLSWTPPEYDGGSKVTGYIIERRDLPEGCWMRCNFTNIPETYFDVTGLTQDQQYDFRVTAKNAAGLFSIPSDNTGPITVKDDVDPPRIMMDVKFKDTVVVKAGETLKINADVAGRPLPLPYRCSREGSAEVG